jgi:hypothetical protein
MHCCVFVGTLSLTFAADIFATGQAGAIRLGISKALNSFEPLLKSPLKTGNVAYPPNVWCWFLYVFLRLSNWVCCLLRNIGWFAICTAPCSRHDDEGLPTGGAKETWTEEGKKAVPVGQALSVPLLGGWLLQPLAGTSGHYTQVRVWIDGLMQD